VIAPQENSAFCSSRPAFGLAATGCLAVGGVAITPFLTLTYCSKIDFIRESAPLIETLVLLVHLGALCRSRDPSLSLERLRRRRRPKSGVDCSAQCKAGSWPSRLAPCGSSLASLSLFLMVSFGGGITSACAHGRSAASALALAFADITDGALTVFGRLVRRSRTFFFSMRSSR